MEEILLTACCVLEPGPSEREGGREELLLQSHLASEVCVAQSSKGGFSWTKEERAFPVTGFQVSCLDA